VTDSRGVQWSVRRRRTFDLTDLPAGGMDESAGLLIIVLIAGWWPFWFIAHWLGLRWRILIERDGEEVHEEWVRGWRKSGQRIREIIESAPAGTLDQSLNVPPAAG
jgi:hypothetical protein